MNKILNIVPRWLPALLLMLIIFGFSSQTDGTLPDFQSSDKFIKKTAHVIIYGALALSYYYALPDRNYRLAWFFAILYAATDEFHQSFVPGRRALVTDVLVFDNLGAVLALFLYSRFYGVSREEEIH